jgi:cephalosporin hydroxylase
MFVYGPSAVADAAVAEHGALQKPDELARFLTVLDDAQPEVVVEIGCDAGGTLWAWQQLLSVERVIGISLPLGPFATARALETTAEVLIEDSQDPATVAALWRLLGRRHTDVLFIDGDHSYAGVRSDWETYEPLVRPGGIVAFHDICPHPAEPDVEMWKLWAELPAPKYEIVAEPATWGGIGWYRTHCSRGERQ